MMEFWKQILGYEGIYSVSNTGRVRRDKGGPSTRIGKILKPCRNSQGYYLVKFCCYGEQKNKRVHQLVFHTFIGEVPHTYEINHKDGNKKNNHLDNLELLTHKENCIHAARTGLRKPATGDRNGNSKFMLANKKKRKVT